MAQQMRGGGLYIARKEGIKNTGPTPGRTFCSSSSASCLGRVVFKTLDAKDYFSYDLNFAGKPEEWT